MGQPLRGALVTVIGLVLIGFSGVSHAQLVLYDDFSSLAINPEKWHGHELTTGPLVLDTDISREVNPDIAPLLRMSLTSYGSTNSDSGLSGAGRNGLQINNPGPVTAIQADVTVGYRAPVADDCPANETPTQARAFLIGSFFNDGSSGGPMDLTGNIYAGFEKLLDSKSGNLFVAFLGRCADSVCPFATTLTFQVFANTWSVGIPDTLRLEWMQGTGQFRFTLNPDTPGEEAYTLTTSLPVAARPVLDFKELRIDNRVANCTAGRRQASMNALFGNVMINLLVMP